MNIIIVGCGKVGKAITQELNGEGHNIVVIDTNQDALDSISSSLDIMTINGNGIQAATLQDANASEADLLIAVTSADEVNILSCLMAKKFGTTHTISRVRNPEYNDSIHLIKDDLGLSMVINPELIAAQEIARLVRFPSAIEIDTFVKGNVELFKLKIHEGSILDGMFLNNAPILNKFNVRISGVERGNEVIIPNGDFQLKANDKISIIGNSRSISKFCKKIKLINSNVGRNVILVGGGKISFYLARKLIASGVDVKIIEINHKRCQFLSETLKYATIIEGDGTDQQLLLEEGVETADALATLTDFDEENIILSLFVQTISKCKIITKINKLSFDKVIESLNLDSIIHPKNLAAKYIVRYVRAMHNSYGKSNIETLYSIMGSKAEALEFKVKEHSKVVDIPLKDLKLKDNLQVACIYRKDSVIIPTGNDYIQQKDTVIIITTHSGFDDIDDILE
ncbi:MAG: Trk system potassium transporter TrkA [Clostridioides sp.]|jgi:trk system potassium uptake protein TrkA|nr:Trk system potassium transporter TrkA [Clostridioides sp.]